MFFVPVTQRTLSGTNSASRLAAIVPALDLAETDSEYTVRVDIPGVAKDQVKINIDGRQVSVEADASTAVDKTEQDRIVYRERSVSRYARRFTLPREVDQAASSAKLDNGVLTLTLAKRNGGAAQLTIN